MTETRLAGRLEMLRRSILAAADNPVHFEDLAVELFSAPPSSYPLLENAAEQAAIMLSERGASQQSALESQISKHEEPVVAIVDTGTILAANASARSLFQLQPGDTYEALGINRDAFDRFRARIAQPGKHASLLLATAKNSNRPTVMSGGLFPGYEAILLSALQWNWPPALFDALREVYSLSHRECEVLAGLCRGESAGGIAREGGRSSGTIRQQIKSILSKLGVNSQTQAVAFVSAAATALSQYDAMPLSKGPSNTDVQHFLLKRSAERMIGVRKYGATDGLPVMLMHGSLFGIGELVAERDAAAAMGLTFIAPERPGYGRTLPCPDHSGLVDTVVDDAIAVLDDAGIERIVLVGHDFGVCFALALAQRHASRISGIVGVSTLPPITPAIMAELPAQQRVFAWAAHHAPWLMDFLVQLGVARMRRMGATNWPQAVFADVEIDYSIASRNEILPAIVGAYAFNIAQDALGFRLDLPEGNTDWSHLLEGIACPIRLVHGVQNRTAPIKAVKSMIAGKAGIELEEIEGAGHTLVVSHPHLASRLALTLSARAALI